MGPIHQTKSEADLFAGIDKVIQGEPLVTPHLTQGRVKLKRASNQVVFIEDPNFLAGPDALWPEQFKIIRDFFELLCPICNDIKYIQDWDNDPKRYEDKSYVPRSDQILFEYNICPSCGTRKIDVLPQLRQYNELIGVAGMRSGKSSTIACIASAHIHDVLCEDRLSEKLGLIKSQTLDASFAASSSEQVQETVYGLFRGLYDESPWFKQYREKLLDLEIADKSLRRSDLYWDTDNSIFWKDKRIRVRSISSNSAAQAGRTRFMSIVDELSRLDSGSSKLSAQEVYRVLDNSLLTLRAACKRAREQGDFSVPDGLMISISSPLFSEDKSMRLLKDAQESKKMFAFKKATWEFNPLIKREDLDDAFNKDPLGAERDYGANPPGAENPFIEDASIVDWCIDTERRSIFDLREDFFDKTVQHAGQNHTVRYVKVTATNIRFNNLTEYYIHCDPGESGDSFCLAIGHKQDSTIYIDGAIEIRPIPKNNPHKLPPRVVHFPSITDFITELSKKVTLSGVSYDRWNSKEQIDRLIDAGIFAVKKNINRDEHINFKNCLANRSVSLPVQERTNCDPKNERNVPCAKAIYELKRLNDSGVKVDHPTNGSNDMIQCYIGVHRFLYTPDVMIPKDRRRAKPNKPNMGHIIKFRR